MWGVEAAKTGAFAPPPPRGAMPYADLQAVVLDAIAALEAVAPEDLNPHAGVLRETAIHQPVDVENPTTSAWAAKRLAFTPETYLLSYALPNFHFHAVTAYAILRAAGAPIGKYHYQGVLRAG